MDRPQRPGATADVWAALAAALLALGLFVAAGVAVFGSDRSLPSDLSYVELGDLAVGTHFYHDGELWVRLSPDPDRPDGDDRPRVLVARLTGPAEGLGVPVVTFGGAWVQRVAVSVTRAKNHWE